MRQNHEGAVSALTQVLQLIVATTRALTFEVTVLDKKGGNYEEFAFRFSRGTARRGTRGQARETRGRRRPTRADGWLHDGKPRQKSESVQCSVHACARDWNSHNEEHRRTGLKNGDK